VPEHIAEACGRYTGRPLPSVSQFNESLPEKPQVVEYDTEHAEEEYYGVVRGCCLPCELMLLLPVFLLDCKSAFVQLRRMNRILMRDMQVCRIEEEMLFPILRLLTFTSYLHIVVVYDVH
jgi:hypothetical protein